MNNVQQLEQVEITIEQAKEAIELKKALLRLHENKDFKAIIDEGFFKVEAARLCEVRSDPMMCDDESQKVIDNQITAIGGLRQYLLKVFNQGTQMENALEGHERTREDILMEG
jgi:hypothetical protein